MTQQEKISEKLDRFGIYVEKSYNGKWCYKDQLPELDCIIVSHEDKEKAAGNFFIEWLKGMHYSIVALHKGGRSQQLKTLLEMLVSFKDENIDKTVEIVTRQYRIQLPI